MRPWNGYAGEGEGKGVRSAYRHRCGRVEKRAEWKAGHLTMTAPQCVGHMMLAVRQSSPAATGLRLGFDRLESRVASGGGRVVHEETETKLGAGKRAEVDHS